MIIIKNVNLKEYSNMKVGGIAKKLIFIEHKEELKDVLKNEENIFLIGNGTNVLFDDGFHNICLVSLKKLNKIKIVNEENDIVKVKVEAGLDFKEVIKYMNQNDLGGIENMTGIPGSMGGIVNMNAGAYGTEIFDVIDTVEIIDNNLEIRTLNKKDLEYNYRNTDIKKNKWIVISTTLNLHKGFDKECSDDKIYQREHKHPLIYPNLGSTFKNPKGEFAAQIISDLGLKNYQIGNACISPIHPNFITNLGNAKFNDIMTIINNVKKIVKEKRNIDLDTEIIILKNK